MNAILNASPSREQSRFCVTGAPKVFLANAKGPWIFPDAIPVNLVSIREAGPYAVRADIRLDGRPIGFKST